MTCNECRDEMPAKALGGIPQGQADQLEAHLADCAECREEWESVSQGLSLMNAWEVESLPAELSARTLAALQAEAAEKPGFWKRLDLWLQRFARHRPTPLTGLATVCVTALLLGHVLSPNLFRGRSSDDGTGCQRNLKVIVQALEVYGKEHNGQFPDRLEHLQPDYLKEMPECPDSGKDSYSSEYSVSSDHRSYQLRCAHSQ